MRSWPATLSVGFGSQNSSVHTSNATNLCVQAAMARGSDEPAAAPSVRMHSASAWSSGLHSRWVKRALRHSKASSSADSCRQRRLQRTGSRAARAQRSAVLRYRLARCLAGVGGFAHSFIMHRCSSKTFVAHWLALRCSGFPDAQRLVAIRCWEQRWRDCARPSIMLLYGSVEMKRDSVPNSALSAAVAASVGTIVARGPVLQDEPSTVDFTTKRSSGPARAV